MQLTLQPPIKSLNKAYLKEKVSRNNIELFKKNLRILLNRIKQQESEEHLKNLIADFLKDTWYKEQLEINTKLFQNLSKQNIPTHFQKTLL